MQPMSSRWLPAMFADNLTIYTYAQVFAPLGTVTPGQPLATLAVVKGQVTVDVTSAVRRSLASAVVIPQPADPLGPPVPASAAAALFPDGNEIVIYKGCVYADGTTEVATLGRFLMEDVEVYDDGSGSGGVYVELNGSDRAATVSRALFTAPYSTDGISPIDVQIKALLNSQIAGLSYNFSVGTASTTVAAGSAGTNVSTFAGSGVLNVLSTASFGSAGTLQVQTSAGVAQIAYTGATATSYTGCTTLSGSGTLALGYAVGIAPPVPAQANFAIGDDPFKSAMAIAASCGYELFFDAFGVCTLRLVVNPAVVAPSVSYPDGGITTSVQRSLTNPGVPNLVILTSQGSNVPVPLQSVWWDSDTASPTFYNAQAPPLTPGATIPSPQGAYPTTVVSSSGSTAITQAANDQAAQSLFLATKGAFETIDLKIRDNPAHDVEDVIAVSNAATGISNRLYIIDTITHYLDGSQEQEMKGRVVL